MDDDGSGRRQALTDDTVLQRTVHLTHKDPSQLHIRPVQLPGHKRRTVATRLRCGGIFKYELVANLPVSQPVKEF